MNVERLTRLAEWLEAGAPHERIKFDMTSGILVSVTEGFDPSKPSACNTSCCIAGATVEFYGNVDALATTHGYATFYHDPKFRELGWNEVRDEAEKLLGLEWDVAEDLFVPADLEEVNDPAWAARTIRHLIVTGEVNWELTRSPEGGAT